MQLSKRTLWGDKLYNANSLLKAFPSRRQCRAGGREHAGRSPAQGPGAQPSQERGSGLVQPVRDCRGRGLAVPGLPWPGPGPWLELCLAPQPEGSLLRVCAARARALPAARAAAPHTPHGEGRRGCEEQSWAPAAPALTAPWKCSVPHRPACSHFKMHFKPFQWRGNVCSAAAVGPGCWGQWRMVGRPCAPCQAVAPLLSDHTAEKIHTD